jgi:hypothetical protein
MSVARFDVFTMIVLNINFMNAVDIDLPLGCLRKTVDSF